MKKIILLVLLLCVAGFAHAEMIIINGDFEAGLSSWSTWGSGSGSGTAGYLWWSGSGTIAPTGGSDGGQYGVLDTTALEGYMDSWGWCWQGFWQSDIPATPGEQFTLSGYFKDISVTGDPCHVVNVFYEWEDSAGDRVDYDGDGIYGAGNPDNNDDRTRLRFPLTGGGSWVYFTVDYTVPTCSDPGCVPFANPIAQFNVLFSVEGAPIAFGLDQLIFGGAGATLVYPPHTSINIPTTAVLEWGPPPTFTPIAYDVYISITDPNADKPWQLVEDHNDVTTYDPPNLAYDTKYYWRVDAYDPCDVISIPSTVWNFTTWPVEPVFTTDAKSATVEVGSSAQFYVQTPRANTFQWYKEPSTAVNHGDDGGDVSVVTDADSSTLTISNVELADEDYYYCVATGTGSTESNHARLLTKRLMGYWNFNGDLNDSVAGNNGTLVDPNVLNPPPGAPVFNAGIPGGGGAINLTTNEIYVEIPNQEYFNFFPQGCTVSCWAMAASENPDWQGLVSKMGGEELPEASWALEKAGAVGYGWFANNEAYATTLINDEEWHHLALVYDADADTLTLYVDGVAEGTATGVDLSSRTPTDAPLRIGTYGTREGSILEGWGFYGWMDNVMIANYPWDGYEVATEYTDHGGDPVCVEPVPGDLNDDCVINTGDLVIAALNFLDCNLIPVEACD